MDEVATKIIEILRKNMKDPSKTVTLGNAPERA
jgi:hypothetical protein